LLFPELLVIDPTNLGWLNLRLSKDAPQDEREERGIDEKAVEFHTKSRLWDLDIIPATSLPSLNESEGCKKASGSSINNTKGSPAIISVINSEHRSVFCALCAHLEEASISVLLLMSRECVQLKFSI
jgi:hypothetical protein